LEADSSSTLIFAETICSGRIARDERHAYALYSSRVEAHNPEGTLLFVDHNYISPNDATPVAPGLMGSYDVLGIMHILTPSSHAPELAVTLQNLVSDAAVVLGGACQLPAECGVTMRLLGRRMEEVTAVVQDVCKTVRAFTFDRTESSGKERDH
ncbi:MAG: urease accessory protein UreD, partial [bacterium]